MTATAVAEVVAAATAMATATEAVAEEVAWMGQGWQRRTRTVAGGMKDRWREWGTQFEVCNYFLSGYAFQDEQNLHVHTLSLNLHTRLGTKRVLKTELGTQKILPTEMT